MDADYLNSMVAEVLAKGCAATVAIQPPDPVAYLSHWLLKYVDNVSITKQFYREKEDLAAKQAKATAKAKKEKVQLEDDKSKRSAAIDGLRGVKNDPYLLWKSCLEAITIYTSCSSSYVSVVIDKLWEPKRDVIEGEEEEEAEGEEITEEEEEEEEVEEEEEEEEEEAAVEEVDEGSEPQGQEGQEATVEGESGERKKKKKKEKPPKPINYKKKILLYAAATPQNDFFLNTQMTRKLVPVTFRILMEKLQQLHIPNVLYQEGIKFFGAVPRVGAYYVVPITIQAIPPQVVALLCVDTLKTETVGSGKPLSYQDMEFILGASFVVTEIMNENHVENMKDLNTSEMIEQLHEQFKQIQDERKEFVRKEKADKKAQEKAAAAAAAAEAAKATGGEGEEGEQGVREEVTEEEEEAPVEGEEADDLGDALVEDPELDEEKENEEEETAVEEEPEGEDEEEEEGGEGELEETDEKQKNLKGIQKNLAKQKRKMEKAQQVLEKTTTSMEKQAGKVLDLEEKIHKLGNYTKYLMALCNAVMTVLDKVMEREIQRILRWPFPPTVTYRVLKGVLHMLGHEKTVYDNWILARQVFGSTFYDELKSYKAFDDADLSKWKFADKCLDELTDEVLQVEAPVAYLGKEWLLSVKTIMRAGAKHRKLTKIHDDEAQKLADAQLQVLVSDLEIKVLLEEEERMSYSEQRLLAEMEEEKIAKEQAEAKESEQRSEEVGSGGGGDGEEEEEQ